MELKDKLEILADAAKYDYKPAHGAASSDLLRRNLADAPQQMHLWPELRAA